MTTRRREFEGCFNFRDLGGWRTEDGRSVRWGRLFRSDAVHLMTAADAACARDELRIRTVLDLRNELEIQAGGLGPLGDGGTSRRHLPLSSRRRRAAPIDSATAASVSDRSPEAMVAGYLGILEASSDLIVDAAETLAGDDALPAVFFCAAGKDRTGVLSAVILGALGVRDDDIIEDYVLSEESIHRVIERFAATPGSSDMYRELPPTHFAPRRETMRRVIDEVRRTYGSLAGYLRSKGLTDRALGRLATSLLDG